MRVFSVFFIDVFFLLLEIADGEIGGIPVLEGYQSFFKPGSFIKSLCLHVYPVKPYGMVRHYPISILLNQIKEKRNGKVKKVRDL
jgi:hypothetical protein